MTNKQRLFLMAARDRAARVREQWEQEDDAWQSMRPRLLSQEQTMHRNNGRAPPNSIDTLAMGLDGRATLRGFADAHRESAGKTSTRH